MTQKLFFFALGDDACQYVIAHDEQQVIALIQREIDAVGGDLGAWSWGLASDVTLDDSGAVCSLDRAEIWFADGRKATVDDVAAILRPTPTDPRPRKRKVLTREMKDEIAERWHMGELVADIARAVGVCPSTVGKVARQYGYEGRRPHGKGRKALTAAERVAICHAVAAGEGVEKISKRFVLAAGTVGLIWMNRDKAVFPGPAPRKKHKRKALSEKELASARYSATLLRAHMSGGLSVAEIAKAEGLPYKTVHSRIRRAKIKNRIA